MNLMWWILLCLKLVWANKIKAHFKNRLFVINRKVKLTWNLSMCQKSEKQNLAKFDCRYHSYFQTSMPNQTKFISMKKRCLMKLWVKYHFSSLINSTTVVTLAFCILDRFSSILHNKISKDQTKLLSPLSIKSWTIFLARSQFLPVMHKVRLNYF